MPPDTPDMLGTVKLYAGYEVVYVTIGNQLLPLFASPYI